MAGKSPYTQPVQVEADASVIGTVRAVAVTHAGPNSLFGRLVADDAASKPEGH